MSSILNSGIAVTNIGGSMDDITFSRNQWGPYVKGKSAGPSGGVPWLAPQQAIVQNLVSAWQIVLTDAERMLWIEAAGYSKNKVTKRVLLKGFQLYMRTNLNIRAVGGTAISQPASAVPLLIVSTGTLSLSLGIITFTWTPNPPGLDWRMALYASDMLSPGRMTPSVPFTYMSSIGAVVGLLDFTAPYVARYGAFVAGRKIWVKAQPINWITGQRSPAFYASILT